VSSIQVYSAQHLHVCVLDWTKMAPVTGSATARLLLYSFLMVIFTTYVIISARISNECVSALRTYDRDSLLRIREWVEGLSDTRSRYKQAFPPPFIIDPDSSEYLLLCRVPGKGRRKLKKRGSRSGVQVKRRCAAARRGSAILCHGEGLCHPRPWRTRKMSAPDPSPQCV